MFPLRLSRDINASLPDVGIRLVAVEGLRFFIDLICEIHQAYSFGQFHALIVQLHMGSTNPDRLDVCHHVRINSI